VSNEDLVPLKGRRPWDPKTRAHSRYLRATHQGGGGGKEKVPLWSCRERGKTDWKGTQDLLDLEGGVAGIIGHLKGGIGRPVPV